MNLLLALAIILVALIQLGEYSSTDNDDDAHLQVPQRKRRSTVVKDYGSSTPELCLQTDTCVYDCKCQKGHSMIDRTTRASGSNLILTCSCRCCDALGTCNDWTSWKPESEQSGKSAAQGSNYEAECDQSPLGDTCNAENFYAARITRKPNDMNISDCRCRCCKTKHFENCGPESPHDPALDK